MNRKIKSNNGSRLHRHSDDCRSNSAKAQYPLDYGGGYGTGPGKCYGMKAVRTPNLNRMVEEGVIYRAACCTAPISSPSRSAMMTGVHQTVINAHNHRSNRDVPLGDGVKPITYYLREAGYTCILGNSNVMNKGRKDRLQLQTYTARRMERKKQVRTVRQV